MARLRFPGRPGYRFGRLGVHYGASEPKKECDAGTQLIANIHRGLRYFRELFGESDEEEFEGFTDDEIAQVAKRLSTINAALAATIKQKDPSSRKRLSTERHASQLPATGSRVKIRQSYDAMVRGGLVKRTTHISPKVQKHNEKSHKSKRSREGRKAHVKLKTIKIRLGVGRKSGKIIPRGSSSSSSNSDSDSDFEPLSSKVFVSKHKSKKSTEKKNRKSTNSVPGIVRLPERSLAKQLLVKAKAGRNKLQFVLPTVSSRSSRKIIPNKRFLEDSYGEMTSTTMKKVRTEEETLVESVPIPFETVTPDVCVSVASVDPAIDPKLSLFDQPLIVEGKRHRKPSLRLIRQLSDDTPVDNKRSQLVLPSSGCVDSLGAVVVTKRHGQDILRKAKLRLNQAAMNRSKKALARSLKRKMRREQKKAGVSTSLQFLPLDSKPLSVQISPIKFGVLSPETPVFGAAGLSAVSPFGRDSTDLSPFASSTEDVAARIHDKKASKTDGKTCLICGSPKLLPYRYYGVVSCQPCSRFYRRRTVDAVHGGATYVCDKEGKCTVSSEEGTLLDCIACRYKKCKSFFPAPECMKDLLQLKRSYRRTKHLSPKATAERTSPDVGEPMESVEEEPAAEQTPDDFTSVSMTTTSSTPFTKVKDLTKPVASACDASGVGLSSTIGESESLLEASCSSDVAGDVPDSPESVSLSTDDARSRHQPRIKHVCRRACVALGSPATFPFQSELRLSALPNVEKERLLNKPGSPDSDDMSMDEIIRQARDDKDVVVTIKRTPNKAFSALVPRAIDKGVSAHREPSERTAYKKPSWARSGTGRLSKRKMRCRTCKGCLATECGKCPSCLDMPKFGGRGVLKKACIERICVQPAYVCCDTPGKTSGDHSLLRRTNRVSSQSRPSESEGVDEASGEAVKEAPPDEKKSPSVDNGVKHRTTKVKADKQGLAQRMTTRCPSSQSSQKRTVDAVSTPRSKWSVEISSNHRIDVAVTEDYDIDVAWKRGIALVSSSPLCLRNVCLLCGSAGQELIYCHVCCEPFHLFCLEEEERPHGDQLDNWCCRQCLFCQVCGQQNNLLQCDRCQETYHPECLGPNYPTKPSSKKHIWVCTKCVKCKSCGATSPGDGRNAVWTHDFSLCYMCGQLMDKGNFCPVCHKCYSDDDWDSKMIQCSSCECWVHARCEGLTDEMYEIVSFMSEGMTFYCHVCQPTRPVGWQRAIDRLRDRHLGNVLESLLGCERGQLLHTIPASVGSTKKEEGVYQRDPPTSSSTTAMETEAADIAEEPVVVSIDELPLSVAKESCAVAIDALPVGIAKEPCDVAMDALPDGIATEPSTVAMDAFTDGVAMESCTSPIDEFPDDIAKEHSTSAIDELPDGDAGELLGNYTVSFDALLTDSSNETCAVAGSVESPELVPSVAGETSAEDVDGSCNAGLRGFIRTCLDDVGCGSDGETECPHNRRECDKESPTCGPGEGCGRVELEGVMGGVNNGPCTPVEGHQERESRALCVGDLRTENTCGVDGACQRGEPYSHCNADPDCDGTTFDTGDQCRSTGVMSCGVDKSSQPCDSSDVIIEKHTACVGVAAMSPHCTGGSTGLPGCDCRAVAPRTETSGSCRGDTDVVSPESCLEPNCRDNETGSMTDVTQGCEEACTKTADCCKCETECCGTAKTGAVLSSALKINVGRGPLGVNSLEHVMSPCSSSTLTAPDVSPLMDTDSQEEFNECVPSEENVLPTRKPVADRLVTRGMKAAEEKRFPRDLGRVRAKLAGNGYSSIEAFSDDITRIIQDDMSQQEAAQLKMLNTSLQSLFVKQMDKYFPWFCVASSRHWFKNKHCPDGVLPQAVLPPTSDHTYAQWLQRAKIKEDACQLSPFKKVATPQKLPRIPIGTWDGESVTENTMDDSNGLQQIVDDPRRCLFCGVFGDQKPSEAGRLLYAHQDDWVHVNCALWSAEVFEEIDGTLQHVNIAVKRGKLLKCDHCGKLGATVGCCQKGCQANYHFMCARRTDCVFQEDKVVYCRVHRYSVLQKLVSEDNFEVQRRACVELDLSRFLKKSWQKGLPPDSISVLAGSMTLESMGWLTPSSDCKTTLFPVGYCVTRVYWSMIDARRRCIYTCRIIEVKPVHQVTAPVVADMTVVHDRAHPKYSSVAEEEFEERMAAMVARTESNDEPESVVYNENEETMAWTPSGGTPRVSEAPDLERSVPAITSSTLTSDRRPTTQELTTNRKAPGIDLSRLSASTLRLLGKAAVSLTQANVSADVCTDNELQLTTIVDRLNEAAAKNKRSQRSRENSVDGSGSSNHSGSNSREGSVERSSVVRPVVAERVSLQPNLERVAETDASLPNVVAPPSKQPQQLGLCAITSNRPQPQNTSGVRAMITAESSRAKTPASYGSVSVLRTSECQPETVKAGDQSGVARTANGTGHSVSSTNTAAGREKTDRNSSNLVICNIVASTSDSGGATGNKRPVSGAEVVRTVNTSVGRKRYRVVPIVTTQSNHATSVYNAVTKTAASPSTVSSVTHQGSMPSSAAQPILTTLSNHANNDCNAVAKTASTTSYVTCRRDKSSPSPQPILTTLSNRTKNVAKTASVSPVPSVTCQGNKPSSATQPKLSPSFGKTTFLDAFKNHISQVSQQEIRHPHAVKQQKLVRVITNINGTRQEPVYNKHGVLVGHYLVQNSGASRHATKPSSPSDLAHHTMGTVDGDVDSQRLSDCDGKDDLVIDKMLQLDGSRDVKPRKAASSDAKDVSTSRSMANGYDIPLHDKIAQKIKAESLARSIPSDAGPFKCPKCKRLYRTQESCARHALSCDFEVSTSEEEEDDDDEGEEEVSFRSQFQTVAQICHVAGATNCLTADSSHSSANEYVAYGSDPIVESEATPNRCHIDDGTATDDSISYPLQSSRTTSSPLGDATSETSLIASPVKLGQESSVTDVRVMNNGDKERSCDAEAPCVRTLRSGRSRSSIDAALRNHDVNPVVRPLRLHCDVNLVVSSMPLVQPKRGRGRPRKLPRNTAASDANAASGVKSPTQCLRKYGLRRDGVRLPTGLDTPEGYDMARMINCTVDVCQLEMKSPVASGSRVEDSRKCQSKSLDDKRPPISNEPVVIVIDDEGSPTPDTGTPEDGEMIESLLNLTPDTGNSLECAMSESLPNLTPDTGNSLECAMSESLFNLTPDTGNSLECAMRESLPNLTPDTGSSAVGEIINSPAETNVGLSQKSPSASPVSLATGSGVVQRDTDTSCYCPAPDSHDRSISTPSPLGDVPHRLQQLHNSCTDLAEDVEKEDSGLSGQVDTMTPSDHVDTMTPSDHVDTMTPSDHVDTMTPSDHVDTMAPSDHVDTMAPSDHVDEMSPSDHVDTMAPSDHVDTMAPSVHVDTMAPSDHVDTMAPSDHVDTMTPSDHVDTMAPSDHVDTMAPSDHVDEMSPSDHVDEMSPSDHVDEMSPGVCVMVTDTIATTEGSNEMASSDQEYVASTDDVSRTSIDVTPLCQVYANEFELASLPSSHANISVSGHVSPSNSELVEEPAGDLCHTEEATNKSPSSNDDPSDTTVCVSDSRDTTTTLDDTCHTVLPPTEAEHSHEASGLWQTETASNDVHRTDYMPKSLQLLHKSPSSHSTPGAGLLQATPWHKPVLPSPLCHLEASGQINYFGSFSVDSFGPQLLLSGASLPVGQHPLLVMSSLDGGDAAVQGHIAISDPAQIASAYNSGALSTSASGVHSAVQTEYIQGLQDWATIGASHFPHHAVPSQQDDAVAMPGVSPTPTSHYLASDSVSTVTPRGSSVCDNTLKSFVQANISRSVAARSVRTCQSIEMSTIGVPSVHYKQGMHVPHRQAAPHVLPLSQSPSPVRSSLLPSLLAAKDKKRLMPTPIDHVGLYKKAKLHPMAPPVAQSKHRKAGDRLQLSRAESWKLSVQRTYSDTSILRSGRHARVASEQKRHKSVHSSAFGKENRGHIMSEHSHPLIHTSYQQTSLPEAELEEEVVESKAVLPPGGSKASEPCHRDRDSPYLMFEITSDDGFSVQADTCEDAWKAVTERVQDARANARMKQLSFAGVNGLQMFGLNHAVIVQLLEQLQGAKYCRNYHFEYHTYDHRDNDEEPVENPSGVARSEPFIGRKNQEMFSFLLSRYRIKPQDASSLAPKAEEMVHKSQRRATSLDLPMAMRFRHLRQNAKQACDVYRSDIHGRGLFCKRDIDAGEMIIEYAGEVIRSAMTDRREHFYESKGIGCYMFRIDDVEVVDATMKGSAARFINHSCDPSCYSKVIQVDGKKHIIIFAMKAIKRGEELTYDYKFPIEDVKIPCTCGTKRCRRYLN